MTSKREEQAQNTEEIVPTLPSLASGWCWTTLRDISEIAGGITKDQKRHVTTSMREVPYLRVANVQRGYFDLQEIKTILADEEELEALRLKKGDILFTEGGDRDKLGRGWVWNEEIEDFIHQNRIFRDRTCFALVHPKFVSYCTFRDIVNVHSWDLKSLAFRRPLAVRSRDGALPTDRPHSV